MGKMNELARESDSFEEMEGDTIDPQERAYWDAFQSMNYALGKEAFRKAFGGERFSDFTKWIEKQLN